MNIPAARQHDSLSTTWTYVPDPDDRGVGGAWFKDPPAGAGEARVLPFRLPDTTAAGWLFTQFTMTAPSDHRAVISLERTHAHLEIWLNGVRVDDCECTGAPIALKPSGALTAGTNQLAIRVSRKLGRYGHFEGQVGVVRIDSKPDPGITSVFVQPDIRRKRVLVQVDAPPASHIVLTVDGVEARAEGSPGKLVLELPKFEEWTPQHPVVYTLRCELSIDGQPVDTLVTAFAMREFTLRDGRTTLNSKSFALRGSTYRADLGMGSATSVFATAKAAALNALWYRGAPPLVEECAWADEHGLLLLVDATPTSTKVEPVAFAESSIHHLRNHASIAAWNLPDLEPNATIIASHTDWDPTRTLFVGLGATSQITALPAYRDGSEFVESLALTTGVPQELHVDAYCRAAGPQASVTFFASPQITIDEPVSDAYAEGFAQRGLGAVFASPEALSRMASEAYGEGVARMVDALRFNARITACFVGQLAMEQTVSTVIPSITPTSRDLQKTIGAAFGLVRPVIQIDRTNLVPREEIPVIVSLVNDARIEGTADLSLLVMGPTNQVLWKKKRTLVIPKSGKEIWSGSVGASGSPGPHKFIVRIMKAGKIVGENSIDLHVFEPATPCDVPIWVSGGAPVHQARLYALAKQAEASAPVHVVLPGSNSVFAYPEEELLRTLRHVRDGAAALVLAPPDDWNALQAIFEGLPSITNEITAGPDRAALHYARFHPIFDGLPARSLMLQPYATMIAQRAIREAGDEDIAGCYVASGDSTALPSFWANNISATRYGDGRILFTHLRLWEQIGKDPVADRMFVNMLQYLLRRSVPSPDMPFIDHKQVEWFREARATRIRRWRVIGLFPNSDGKGHDTAYPPESQIDFDALYPNPLMGATWKSVCSFLEKDYAVDPLSTLWPLIGGNASATAGTVYAYAEFMSDKRQPVELQLYTPASAKMWINGKSVLDTAIASETTAVDNHIMDGYIRQGKNVVLIKLTTNGGPCPFTFSIQPTPRDFLNIKWWK